MNRSAFVQRRPLSGEIPTDARACRRLPRGDRRAGVAMPGGPAGAPLALAMALGLLLAMPAFAQGGASPTHPPGAEKTAKTRALESGAKLLQDASPVGRLDMHLVGFHPMKDDPSHQMEAHHFCRQVNQEFAQCALFDSPQPDANLVGIEYIISERLYATLPAAEKQYWHPHNYEILSGQLVAPGIPGAVEKTLMRDKMNSYGKTWQVWNTASTAGPGDRLPLGPPRLGWSFNQDGEIDPALLAGRDERLKIDTAKVRRNRADLRPLAHPQEGTDALRKR